ncbi:tyrosine-protein phosphatase [uncultured Friedmanniella sp.]|uniref:tyrosine-protein phosphatase n=1 Tax=uncultured Friedmanniella sp. TaxID=335381 RepID=UPI0035CAD711
MDHRVDRDIADAPGATLVHYTAGKDRTGTIVALALTLVGADRAAVIADYAASSEEAGHRRPADDLGHVRRQPA